MNIAFHTLGCKVNQYETEAIREQFLSCGHTSNPDKKPDVIIINSCTVTAESDRKTRQLVRRCRKNSPDAVIVLTGCMVQAFPEKSGKLSECDVIIGNSNTSEIVGAVEKFIADKKRFTEIIPHYSGEKYNTPEIYGFCERTRAFMKIEDGCERYCSYCIIPFARGPVRSRPVKSVREEAERFAKSGYREIVLVGINLSAYGKGENFDLCDAVDAVCSVEGIERVRLGSLEPDHISDDMLKRFAAQEKFCPQFHLSLQSGCDETLKRMNRHYDSDFYYDLITRIRKIFESASVTTDIMVGFAGETEEEFQKSVDFAKKSAFARAHIFVYSRRNGTVAAALKSQVPNAEKERRAKIMSEAVKQSEYAFLDSQSGKIFPVLFESSDSGFAEGYTPNYTRVRINAGDNLTGQIKNVKIISRENDFCIGEIVE